MENTSYWEEYCRNFGDNDFYRYRCASCKTDAPINYHGTEMRPDKCPFCGKIMKREKEE